MSGPKTRRILPPACVRGSHSQFPLSTPFRQFRAIGRGVGCCFLSPAFPDANTLWSYRIVQTRVLGLGLFLEFPVCHSVEFVSLNLAAQAPWISLRMGWFDQIAASMSMDNCIATNRNVTC